MRRFLRIEILLLVIGIGLLGYGIYEEMTPTVELPALMRAADIDAHLDQIVEVSGNEIRHTNISQTHRERHGGWWRYAFSPGSDTWRHHLYIIEFDDGSFLALRGVPDDLAVRDHVPGKVMRLEDDFITRSLLQNYDGLCGISSGLLPFTIRTEFGWTGLSEESIDAVIGWGILLIFAAIVMMLIHFIVKRRRKTHE